MSPFLSDLLITLLLVGFLIVVLDIQKQTSTRRRGLFDWTEKTLTRMSGGQVGFQDSRWKSAVLALALSVSVGVFIMIAYGFFLMVLMMFSPYQGKPLLILAFVLVAGVSLELHDFFFDAARIAARWTIRGR